ncbi:MAG: hypothetical protein IT307_17125 [Chloroflexi bacterium]|nr:hypothetical protein [Chloroflexota bacterium]
MAQGHEPIFPRSELDSLAPGPESLAERLAQRLGASVQSANIFGQPVEREGVTVVPVAKASWGFGGGGGSGGEGTPGAGSGSGGGGGVSVRPVGFIEISGGQARFRAIHDVDEVKIILASAVATAVLLAGIGSIVSKLRGKR